MDSALFPSAFEEITKSDEPAERYAVWTRIPSRLRIVRANIMSGMLSDGTSIAAQRIVFTLKVRDLIKLVEADGWKLKNTVGSHRQFVHPAKPGKVTVAGHPSKDLALGTVRSILRQAKLL